MTCPVCASGNPRGSSVCRSCGTPFSARPQRPSPALRAGTKLQQGKFTVSAVLGQGGFGITYLATDTALRRRVAIKELFPHGCMRQSGSVVLPPPPSPLNAREFDRAKEWFVKEAQTLARFVHPGIVRVYTEFTENNTAYMVMEYLQGRTLAEWWIENGGAPSEAEAVSFAMAIGQALTEVHEAGVLHRDVKPQNVIVTDDRRTVLLDFGAARELTAVMTVMLTSGFAPMEQYGSGTRVGVSVDVYGLGATLYTLLTGTAPVPAPDRLSGRVLMPPERLNAQVSQRVSKAVMKSMEIDASARYQSMAEFLEALGREGPPSPPVARELIGKPKIVNVANPNAGTSATLIFERPSGVAVDQVTGYNFQKRLSSRIWSEAPAPTRVASRKTNYTFTGLARQSTYVFRVRAYNDSGTGAWSDDSPQHFIPAAPVTRQPLPKPPPKPPPRPTAPTLTRADGSARVTWAKVNGAMGYDLRWRQRGTWKHVRDVVSPMRIAPLVNRERLDVQLRAKNDTGASAWSSTIWLPPRPRLRSAFGVALLVLIMIVFALVAGRDGPGSAPPREDPETTVPGEPPSAAVAPTHPQIRSLVRLEPPAYRTNADSLTWRITFTEAVTSVDKNDFVIIGIRPWRLTVTKVAELGDAYDVTLDGDGLADHNGTVVVGIAPGSYIKNVDGNRLLNVNAEGLFEASYVIDNAAPTVAFMPETGRINDVGGNLTLTFSESVFSDSSDTPFTEATLAGLIDLRKDAQSGAPITFSGSVDQDNTTVTIDPTGPLPAQTWVRVNDGYYDTVGNEGGVATAAFTVDTIRPTVTISGVPATDSGAFMATFTFSEAVTGFTASDVAVTNGTASALTEARDGLQWRVRITPTGDYSVSLPADRVTDLAGNGNAASTSREGSYGPDVTDPRLISIVRQTPSRSPARANSVTWRVTFSEDVEQFNADSVGLLDHRSEVPIAGTDERVNAVEGSASAYDVTFSGSALADHNDTVRLGFLTRGSPDNWISVNVQDTSNRPLPCCGTLGADERTFDVDNVAPRVADIVRSNPGREHTNQDEVAWTVTFSEPVRNLSAGDFTVSGTDAALTVTQEGSGSRTWNVIASGGDLARLNTTIRLSFAGTRDIEDAAGNLLAAIAPTGADENTFVIDSVAPALTSIVRQPPKGSPADAETATWRMTFSEHMRGIDATDFAVHGAKIAVVAAGSKADYDLSVSGEDVIPVRAPISVYINRESDITDLAGNALRVPRPPTTIVLPSSAATPR